MGFLSFLTQWILRRIVRKLGWQDPNSLFVQFSYPNQLKISGIHYKIQDSDHSFYKGFCSIKSVVISIFPDYLTFIHFHIVSPSFILYLHKKTKVEKCLVRNYFWKQRKVHRRSKIFCSGTGEKLPVSTLFHNNTRTPQRHFSFSHLTKASKDDSSWNLSDSLLGYQTTLHKISTSEKTNFQEQHDLIGQSRTFLFFLLRFLKFFLVSFENFNFECSFNCSKKNTFTFGVCLSAGALHSLHCVNQEGGQHSVTYSTSQTSLCLRNIVMFHKKGKHTCREGHMDKHWKPLYSFIMYERQWQTIIKLRMPTLNLKQMNNLPLRDLCFIFLTSSSPVINISNLVLTDFIRFLIEIGHSNFPSSNKKKDLSTCYAPICYSWSRQLQVCLNLCIDSLLVQQRIENFYLHQLKEWRTSKLIYTQHESDRQNSEICDSVAKPLDKKAAELLMSRLQCQFEFSLNNPSCFPTNPTTCKIVNTSIVSFHSSSIKLNSLHFFSNFLNINWNITDQTFTRQQKTLKCLSSSQSSPLRFPLSFFSLEEISNLSTATKPFKNALALNLQNISREEQRNLEKKKNRNQIEMGCTVERFRFTVTSLFNTIHLLNFIYSFTETCNNYPKKRVSLWDKLRFLWFRQSQRHSLSTTIGFRSSYFIPVFTKFHVLIKDVTIQVCATPNIKASDISVHNKRVSCLLAPVLSFQTLEIQNKPSDCTSTSINTMSFDFSVHRLQVSVFVNEKRQTRMIYDTTTFNSNKVTLFAPLTMSGEIMFFFFKILSNNFVNMRSTLMLDSCEVYFPTDLLRQLHCLSLPKSHHGARTVVTSQNFLYTKIHKNRKKQYDNKYFEKFHSIADILYPFLKSYSHYSRRHFSYQTNLKRTHESSAPSSAILKKKSFFSFPLSLLGKKNNHVLKSTQIKVSINTLFFCATNNMLTQSSTFKQTLSLQPAFVIYFDLLKCELTFSKRTAVGQDQCLLPSRFYSTFTSFFLGVLTSDSFHDAFGRNSTLTPRKLKTLVREQNFCFTIISPETPVLILLQVCAHSHFGSEMNDASSDDTQGMEQCCHTVDSAFFSREDNTTRGRLLPLTCQPNSNRKLPKPAFSLSCSVEKINNFDSFQVYKLNATLKFISIVWNIQMHNIGKVLNLSFSLQHQWKSLCKKLSKTQLFFFKPYQKKCKKFLLNTSREPIKLMAIVPFLFLKITHSDINIFTNHVYSHSGQNCFDVFKHSNDKLSNKSFPLFINKKRQQNKYASQVSPPVTNAQVVESWKFQWKTRNLFVTVKSSFRPTKENFANAHFSHVLPTFLGYQLMYALKEVKFKLDAKESFCYTTPNLLNTSGPCVSKKISLFLLVPQNQTYGISCAMTATDGQKSEFLCNEPSLSMSVRLDIALGQFTVQVTKNHFLMLWSLYLDANTIIFSLLSKHSTIRNRRNTNMAKKSFRGPWNDTRNKKTHIILNFLLNSALLELKNTKDSASLSTGKVLLNSEYTYIPKKKKPNVTHSQDTFKRKWSWNIISKRAKATINVAQTLVSCQSVLIDTSNTKKYTLLYAGSCCVDFSRGICTNHLMPSFEQRGEKFNKDGPKPKTLKVMIIRLGGSSTHSSHCLLREDGVSVYLIPATIQCFISVFEVYLNLFRLYTNLLQDERHCFLGYVPHIPTENLLPTYKTSSDMHVTLSVESGMIYASTYIPSKKNSNISFALCLVKGNETKAFFTQAQLTYCKSLTHSITCLATHNDSQRLTECIHISCDNPCFWRSYQRDIIYYRQWKSSILARFSRPVLQQENIYTAFTPRFFFSSQQCQEGQSGKSPNKSIRHLCVAPNFRHFHIDKQAHEWGLQVAYQNNSQISLQQCTHIKIDIPLLCRVNYLKPVALTLQKLSLALLACFSQVKSILGQTCDGFFAEPAFIDSKTHSPNLRHNVLSFVDEKTKYISRNKRLCSFQSKSVLNSLIFSDDVLFKNNSNHVGNLDELKRTAEDSFKGDSHIGTILKEIEYYSSSFLLNFYVKVERLCVWISALKKKNQAFQKHNSIQFNTATGFCFETKVNCNYNCNQVELMDWVGKSFANLYISPHCHIPQWIIKTSFPLSGSLSINVTECACYLGDLRIPCVTDAESASCYLIETFPCSDTFFSTFFKHINDRHLHNKSNPMRVQRISTFTSVEPYLLSHLANAQNTDYRIQDISMCNLLEDVFEATISLNISDMYAEASGSLKNRKELKVNMQCSRLSTQFTLNDYYSFKMLYEKFFSHHPFNKSKKNGTYANDTQVLPSKKLSTSNNGSVVECCLKLILDQPKGVKVNLLHSNLETLALFQFERSRINFDTTTLLTNVEERYFVKFLLTIQRIRLSIPYVKKSLVLAQNISSASPENNLIKRLRFSSDYRLRIVKALYDVAAIMEFPSFSAEINTKPKDASATSMQFHIDDTLHFNVCPETIQWFNSIQKMCQEWSPGQMDYYYITVDERFLSSWLHDTSNFLLSKKSELNFTNNDIVVPDFQQKKNLSFVLDALSRSFQGDGVNQLVKVQDLRQVVDTKKNFNNFTVMIEKECPFKAIDASNKNTTAKKLVSEFFLLSNHDFLLSSFETFNKIQSIKKITKCQQEKTKTKYHILFQKSYIQIQNELSLPLDIFLECEPENSDLKLNSWSFFVNKESSAILPEFASEIHTSVSFRLSNKSNQNWSRKYILKDLLQCSDYVSLYDSDNTHVTCVVGLFCLNTTRNTEVLFSFDRSHKVLELRIAAPLIIKNMLPRSLYCTMIQKETKVQVIVEPFLNSSVTNFNPSDSIFLSQITFENDSKGNSSEHFQAVQLHPYVESDVGVCSNRSCVCDPHELIHKCHKANPIYSTFSSLDSTNLMNQKNLTILKQCKKNSFEVTRVVDGSSINITYILEASQVHLHISAPYWLVNLTKHLLQYTPICFNLGEDKTDDYLTDSEYSSISANPKFFTSELEMRSIQLCGCPSYTQLPLQDFTKRSLHVQAPVERLAPSPFRLLSQISNLFLLENLTVKEKSDGKHVSSVYPSFYTESHNVFKLFQDKKHFTSGRLNHRTNWIMQERSFEEEQLIFDNGQVLILQNHQLSIASRKVTLLLFLPTHLLINRSPRALYVRQTLSGASNEGNAQLVPSGCIKQLHWFTNQDEQHGFQVSDTSTTNWSPLISLGDPQQYVQPLPSFFPFSLSPSSLKYKTNAEEGAIILFTNSQLLQGMVLVDVSTPYVVSTLYDSKQFQNHIPTPPLIVQNNLHVPLYIQVKYPIFASKYITKVPARSQIPFWIADFFENSPTLFEVSVQSLFILSQKGVFFSLKEVKKKELEQLKFTMTSTGKFPLRPKPFSFDKKKTFTGILSLNCINDTAQSFVCICRYAWKMSMISQDNVPVLSIDGVYCFYSTPLHRIPSIHCINQSLPNWQGFLSSGFLLRNYYLVTSEFDHFVSKQSKKNSLNPLCINYPQLFSQKNFGVSNCLQRVDKNASLFQHIFSFFPSCTCMLTFFQISVSVSPLPYDSSRENQKLLLDNISNTKTSASFFVIFSHITVKILWREPHLEKNESLLEDRFLCRLSTREDKTKIHILATLFAVDIIGCNRPFFDSRRTLQHSNLLLSKNDFETKNKDNGYPAFKPHILGRTKAHFKHHEGLRNFSCFLKKKNEPSSFYQIPERHDNVLCVDFEFGLSEKINVCTKKNYYIQWNTKASLPDKPTYCLLFFDGFNVLRSFLPYALTEHYYKPIISLPIDSLSIKTLPIELKLNYTWMSQCLNEFCFFLKEQCDAKDIDTLSCSIENELKPSILKSSIFQVDPVKIKLLCASTWSPILLFKEIKLSPVQFILSIDGVFNLIHLKKASIHWTGKTVMNVTFYYSFNHFVNLLKALGQEQLARNWYTLLLSLNLSCQPMKHLKMWSQHIKSLFFNLKKKKLARQ